MTTPTFDHGRITTCVPAHIQQRLEMAASLVGATVNQFIVQAALHEAERIIEQERVIRLSGDDALQFLEALDNPQPPNEALNSALIDYAQRYNDKTGSLDWSPRPQRI